MPIPAVSRARRTRALVIAGSTVGHVLVLVLIGLNAPGVRRVLVERQEPPPPPFVVELYEPPPPPPPRETPKTQVAAPAPSPAQPRPLTAPLPSPARPRPVAPQAPPAPIAPLPMEPAPRPPAPPAAAPAPVTGAGSGAAIAPFGPAGGDLRNALRQTSPGCANEEAVGLNRRERETCTDRLGKGAKDAPFVQAPMARAKREAFDAAAARKDRNRDWREGGVPSGIQGDGLGGEGNAALWRPK